MSFADSEGDDVSPAVEVYERSSGGVAGIGGGAVELRVEPEDENHTHMAPGWRECMCVISAVICVIQ